MAHAERRGAEGEKKKGEGKWKGGGNVGEEQLRGRSRGERRENRRGKGKTTEERVREEQWKNLQDEGRRRRGG